MVIPLGCLRLFSFFTVDGRIEATASFFADEVQLSVTLIVPLPPAPQCQAGTPAAAGAGQIDVSLLAQNRGLMSMVVGQWRSRRGGRTDGQSLFLIPLPPPVRSLLGRYFNSDSAPPRGSFCLCRENGEIDSCAPADSFPSPPLD